jgi:hypothetical protein
MSGDTGDAASFIQRIASYRCIACVTLEIGDCVTCVTAPCEKEEAPMPMGGWGANRESIGAMGRGERVQVSNRFPS